MLPLQASLQTAKTLLKCKPCETRAGQDSKMHIRTSVQQAIRNSIMDANDDTAPAFNDFESVVDHLEKASTLLKEAGFFGSAKAPSATAIIEVETLPLVMDLESSSHAAAQTGPTCSGTTWSASVSRPPRSRCTLWLLENVPPAASCRPSTAAP